jgi:hypothetical protein
VERPVEKGLGVIAILIAAGVIAAVVFWGVVTPWATIGMSLLGIAFLRWMTRSSALIRSPRGRASRVGRSVRRG